MPTYEIVVTDAPAEALPEHDAKRIGLALRRSDKPDLRCSLIATGLEFRTKHPTLWDDPRLFRAMLDVAMPELHSWAETAEIPEADQPWRFFANAAAVEQILSDPTRQQDVDLYRFVVAGESLDRWDA